MASYELMYIMAADFEDGAYAQMTERLSELIVQNDGQVTKIDVWGKRRLAYEIQKRREGHYTLMYFRAPGETISELDRILRINESVLRHLIVCHEDKDALPAEQKEATAEDVK